MKRSIKTIVNETVARYLMEAAQSTVIGGIDISNRASWPQDARSAIQFASQFQNTPTQGAGWLRNIQSYTNNKEFIQHVRGIINQYYGKKGGNMQNTTNTATTQGTKTSATQNQKTNTTANADTTANTANTGNGQYLDIRKMPWNLRNQYARILSYAYPSNGQPNAQWIQKLNNFKQENSQYLTNDVNFPNFEKLNYQQRKLLMKRLHQSRVKSNAGRISTQQGRIDRYNDTVQNLRESRINRIITNILQEIIDNQ